MLQTGWQVRSWRLDVGMLWTSSWTFGDVCGLLLQMEATLVTFGAAIAACGKRWQMALCLREDMSQAWLEGYMKINETNIMEKLDPVGCDRLWCRMW